MTEEISVVNKQQLDYLDAPPPPLPLCHLTFDLIEEILCRLPVKSLLQFRRVCKSWNALISHPRFAKKHFNMPSTTVTTTRHHLYCLNSSELCNINTITCCPVNSTLSTLFKERNSTLSTKVTNFKYPSNILDGGPDYCSAVIVGSLNGIFCIAQDRKVMLWNPSIDKFKKLPRIEDLRNGKLYDLSYGFGYDRATGNYKVVYVLYSSTTDDLFKKPQVRVNTVGTNFWKNIQNFPFDSIPDMAAGKCVSGTINWLASKHWSPERLCFIVSLDLSNYSYQKILSPPHCEQKHSLSVLRDCLCMVSGHDIWIMKEYGNKDSWTKLYTVSYLRDPSKLHYLSKALYIFDDDQVLLESEGEWGSMLVVYDPKINTLKFIKFEDNESGVYNPIYDRDVESLIWPWSE